MKFLPKIALLCFILLCCITLQAQSYEQGSTNFAAPKKYDANSTTRILFIFDDSFSMYGRWGNGTKIDVSKKLMGEFLDSLKNTPKLQLALRCYGHQTPFRPNRNCEDS
ncbi:MAG TPA: hypothetical protein VK835_14485, partial [Bacteroidia bacterium]|nr:hypothetical protein [Bacteroidia bacterium]